LRVIRVDDAAFLGFGPRTPSAATEVAAALRQP
jgi:ABC-type hemin transport system substrate-binding protein